MIWTTGRLACAIFLAGLGLVSGCQQAGSSRPTLPPAVARFYLEQAGKDSVTVALAQGTVSLVVGAKPVLTEYDFLRVETVPTGLGLGLRFWLTPAAATDLQRMVNTNPAQRLVLLVDGKPLGLLRVDQTGGAGTLLVKAEVTDEQLPALASQLQRTSLALHPVSP